MAKIARNRPLKVAIIGVLHYKSGLGEAKNDPKKAKRGQKSPPNQTLAIWGSFVAKLILTSEKVIFVLSP